MVLNMADLGECQKSFQTPWNESYILANGFLLQVRSGLLVTHTGNSLPYSLPNSDVGSFTSLQRKVQSGGWRDGAYGLTSLSEKTGFVILIHVDSSSFVTGRG